MARVAEKLELSDFGIAPRTAARLREFGAGLLIPIQPDEWTIDDFKREAGITDAQARNQIEYGVKAGEIIKVMRLRYRLGEPKVNGNKMAYKFVEAENAKAKHDKKNSTSKTHRRPR